MKYWKLLPVEFVVGSVFGLGNKLMRIAELGSSWDLGMIPPGNKLAPAFPPGTTLPALRAFLKPGPRESR